MSKDDIAVLKSIQKNTEMAIKAIETVEPKASDQALKQLLEETSGKYFGIHHKAVSKLVEDNVQPEKSSTIENIMLVGGITGNTMLNTSASHLAELMIKGSNMGITDLNKTLNHHAAIEKETLEIARELLDLEKFNLEEYKKYL